MTIQRALAIIVAVLVPLSALAGTSVDATINTPGLGSMKYRVYFPDSYKSTGPTKTPVILYLHSAAERGDSVDHVFSNSFGGSVWTNNWIGKLVDETQQGKHQAILVIPQSGLGQSWNSMTAGDNWTVGSYTNATQKPISSRLQLAIDIVEKVVKANNANPNKVYVTGPSMGGYGSWDAIGRFPTKFAAAMPLSGGGNTDLARAVLAKKPIWSYTGAKDGLVPPSGTTNMYFASRQAGGTPLISYVAEEGHGGFDLFYTPGHFTVSNPQAPGGSGEDVYDWLFSQDLSKQANPLKPIAKNAPVVVGFGPGSSGNDRTNYTANGTNFITYNFVEARDVDNLTDVNGSPSGISIRRTGEIAPSGGMSTLSPAISNVLPTAVTTQSLYVKGQPADPDASIVFTLGGLDDREKYTIDILGSIPATEKVSRVTRYTLVGRTKMTGQVDVINNADKLVTFTDVSPEKGKLTLTVQGVDGAPGYINAVLIARASPDERARAKPR